MERGFDVEAGRYRVISDKWSKPLELYVIRKQPQNPFTFTRLSPQRNQKDVLNSQPPNFTKRKLRAKQKLTSSDFDTTTMRVMWLWLWTQPNHDRRYHLLSDRPRLVTLSWPPHHRKYNLSSQITCIWNVSAVIKDWKQYEFFHTMEVRKL